MSPGARSRVLGLVEAARRIADPADPLGEEARRVLPSATGLSPENVELCLRECLETHPSDEELAALLDSVPEAQRVHVVLGANVFVAAHRALALALAASERPQVRPSRREPEMTRLLARGAPGLFDVVAEIQPAAGDHVFAYGSDDTMRALAAELRPGVVLHAHGSGMGIVVTDPTPGEEATLDLARAVARDVVPFDQRGCLSPRLLLVQGSAGDARDLARALAEALAELEERIPRGVLHPEERAARLRFRDSWLVAGDVLAAGSGFVSVDDALLPAAVPPPGRHVHVRFTPDLDHVARGLAPLVTSVAVAGSDALRREVAELFAGARITTAGKMQRPPLDGPVDRRALPRG